jgi:hypothetical protein
VAVDESEPNVDFTGWAPIIGRWDLEPDRARYRGPESASGEPAVGLLRAPDSLGLTAGRISTILEFPADQEEEPQGRIVFGFNPRSQHHYSAGLGGYGSLYCVEELVPREGYVPLATWGRAEALQRDRPYLVSVYLRGQSVALDVDDVVIADVALPTSLQGAYLGLTARGIGAVEFTHFVADGQTPEAFVVMKYGEPFDTLYNEVIGPVCLEMGYFPVRADEYAGPGLIMQDILSGIRDASVVIAEITPVNANVFYELGYTHATGKPTILLADRDEVAQLPFDISGHRCIFYNDTIGGKPRVEADLRRHLDSLTYGGPAPEPPAG